MHLLQWSPWTCGARRPATRATRSTRNREQANWKLKLSDGKRKTKSDSTELEFRLQGDMRLDQHARSREVVILLKTKLNLFVAAEGVLVLGRATTGAPPTLGRVQTGLNWIHGPLGQNRMAQYCRLKNPNTPDIRPETPDKCSDVRSLTRILWVYVRRLWTKVRTSDPQPEYSGYTLGCSGFSSE